MTAALLLARAGHAVTLFEGASDLGGLWSTELDADGLFRGENSCKVYQSTYHTTPALFELLGTRWQDHFTARHDLRAEWLRPLIADCTVADLARLGTAFGLYLAGLRSYKDISVAEYLQTHDISDPCTAWLRATALGGVTGTLRMTMWELFFRLRCNLPAIFSKNADALHWNSQPPNCPDGFIGHWKQALIRAGVNLRLGAPVLGVDDSSDRGSRLAVRTEDGSHPTDAVFLAVPPPALARLLSASAGDIASGFGSSPDELIAGLRESVYEHLGLVWFFDRPLPTDLPLGGHNVRRGWHPILVQHSQYRAWLRQPAITTVLGSISLATDFRHHRLNTVPRDHPREELAHIVWEDERAVDSTLPEPIESRALGLMTATQIVHRGPLPVRAAGHNVFIATNLNGRAPYFTSSIESAIQAGAAAARVFDSGVERLPTGTARWQQRLPWPVEPTEALAIR